MLRSTKTTTFILLCAAILLVTALGMHEKVDDMRMKLVKVVVMNRHGHRAPNPPYWRECPNDAYNRFKYNVDSEDLTGLGMQQEYDFGLWLRHRYSKFIGGHFNRTKHFFRAVGEPRTLQSAVAVAQGTFPDGFGPGGFLPSRPQFVPIFSDMEFHEYLLDDAPCWKKSGQDSEAWTNTKFDEFMSDPQFTAAIAELRTLCGQSAGPEINTATFVKLVVDGVIFNHDYGLNVLDGKISPSLMYKLRNISIQLLIGRLYDTDQQKTYMSMEFPKALMTTFEEAQLAKNQENVDDFVHPIEKLEVYVCHRELLYAWAEFFGFDFSVPPLPPLEIPVSTSLVFELLHDDKTGVYYVRTLLYTPEGPLQTIAYPGCRSPRLCTVGEMNALINARIARTGSWQQICDYHAKI